MSESHNTSELPGVRPEIIQRLAFADRVLVGDYGFQEVPDIGTEPCEEGSPFSGVIIDTEDKTLTQQEIDLTNQWVANQLGDAKTSRKLISPEGGTTFEVFDKELPGGYRIVKSQTEGKGDATLLWPEDVLEWQIEAGYEYTREG
ncbi:MAG TPA: hypothetical protein VLE91_00370 [Candidatus Saccharimonadales bacterium]|nr:hypothetical protein [Candidatus Saccharimonadales bacterium]